MNENSPIDCVGIICFRGDDVLLIKRGKPPKAGEWSIPGGHIEDGETEIQAALRELHEETGVRATLGVKIATISAQFDGVSYTLHDYVALWKSGEPQAGDDAAQACFVNIKSLTQIEMWQTTKDVITTARQTHEKLNK